MRTFRGTCGLIATACCAAVTTSAMAQAPGATTYTDAQDIITEVIVTAQRRAERLQDVPIAISVQSGEQLEKAGVTNLRDITTVIPGLSLTGTGTNLQPVMRGVGSQQTDPGNDPNVALYLDGVYQASQIANSFDLPDVQQIEVLKGPQGTLFGRNATGGAIRIFTLEPDFTATGRIRLDYGRFDNVVAKGFLSGPLLEDTVAASLSVYREEIDGYSRDVATGRNDVGGVDSTVVRGKLLARPNDSVKLLLSLGYMDRRDEDTSKYSVIGGNTIAQTIPGAVFGQRPYEVAANGATFLDSTVRLASLKADFELGVGTLSSMTAYNKVDALYTLDSDASNADLLFYNLNELQEDYSQEFIFSTNSTGRWHGVGGLFFYHSDGRYDPLDILGAFAGPEPMFVWSRQVTEAYAVFGELTFDLTDRLTLVGGARYSDEKRTAYGTIQVGAGPEPAMPKLGAKSWDSFTPRVSLRYRFLDDDTIYLTYSEGFKSGGFNIAAIDPVPFNPEKLQAIELGVKTSPNRRLSANVAAFYYDYSDQQVMTVANNFNITANAASSEIYGLDADMTMRVTRDFTLTAGLSLLQAEFERYPNASVLEPISGPISLTSCPSGIANCGNEAVVIDASGFKAPKSPEWTLGLTANYAHEFQFGDVELSAALFHSDEFYWDANERIRQPSYTTVSAQAAWQPRDSRFKLSLWGKNLTNEKYMKTTFMAELVDGAAYARPRTYGLGVEYGF